MGFFSTIKAAVSTPAKQSVKVTSWVTKAASTITSTVKKVAGAVATVVKGVAEAVKKKQEAEAAAKKKTTTKTTTTKKQTTTAKPTTTSVNKQDLIAWGSTRFYVTPTFVRSFKGLQISASCETEDEKNGGTKYVKKKNDGGYEVKLTAILDKRLGETDVRKEALKIAERARTGGKDYIYCCGSKLFTPQMMGTGASVKNIVTAPDGTWISCEVELTLKQCSKGDGSTSPPATSGGSGYKYSVTVYYSGSSGAISSVTGYSNVSKEDARKKAWAKVPGNAQWASETKKQATNQTTAAKDSVKKTTQDAKKDAEKYVNDKTKSVSKPAATKITPAKKPVALLK